ncbi:glycoside hydrolase family 2 TIM barrel-domain containing protein [Marinoscillum furvescens]|uniref:Beta-galactosidase n=1 Tax=Marinoscillum furvescens DSM 4134 TaxID=1122208 RepID=A0A3D9LFV4_MARFU|nr:glycoside hydrolase family 2 TIM barrel-domain containing protein [Marinoscillum furvescens]REE05508.1 beta-galactosidase [Marinoscillum furvescens DSM 4134]
MKIKRIFRIASMMVFITMIGHQLAGQVRRDVLINFDWKFIQKDIDNAYLKDFDDSNWQEVQLPHDASIYGPFLQDSLGSDRKNGFRPRLKGWYRKSLRLEHIAQEKRYFLEFEGVYRDARVYFNERLVARQPNGYEEFEADITDLVHEGENQIAVFYDNTYEESSRWYNGEGIYRDVWLKERNPTYILKDGIALTTPFLTDELAKVSLLLELQHAKTKEEHVTLKTAIYDAAGKLVTSTRSVAPLLSGELYTYRQNLEIENPIRWSLENPYLYQVVTSIYVEDKKVDELTTALGVRSLEFDPNKGFLLNSKKVLVKGVNIHHDLGPLGAAAFERGFERRLEGLKALGCNAIRLSHNPHDKYILDWCDRNGMLVYDEAFDKWAPQFFGPEREFKDHWRSSLAAFIRRDRNHPSVFIWSVGNETHQQKSPKENFGVDMMKEMADFVHKLDPSRSVTCGLHPSRKSGAYRTEDYYYAGPPEMEFYMDVVSTNYREEFWPVDHSNYPQLTFILSEAQVGNLGNEWFNFNHDYGVGMFYWGGTDYIGESFGWPAKGWPNGIIDWNDHWKPFSYYIQSLYSDEPMVYIAAYDPGEETMQYWNEVNLRFQPMFSHWNWEGRDSIRLMTFSNAQEIELLINGKSIGIKKVPEAYFTKDVKAYTAEQYDPENPINTGPELHKKLEWVVPYSEGKIEAKARIDGKVVATYELETAGQPYALKLEPDRQKLQANGLDLSYLTVSVVDKQGRLVPDAEYTINFEVSGCGVNAGVSNANVISNEPFQGNSRKTFQGKALLVVRATRDTGKIKVKAASNGLKSETVELNVIEGEKLDSYSANLN